MCTLGGLTFNNFTFTNIDPPPTDAQVTVTPTTDASGNVILQLDGAFSSAAGSSMNVDISYLVMASTPIISGQSLAMAGYGQAGDGSVNVADTICLGGVFLPTGQCTGTGEDSILVFDDGTSDSRPFDSTTFSPAQTEIDVIKAIDVDGGTAGTNDSAAVSEVFNTSTSGGTGRSATPEPNTVILMGSALLMTGLLVRRRCQG